MLSVVADARVSELLLRDLHRHVEVVEQRRMDVAELMPRHTSEPRRLRRRLQHVRAAAWIPATDRPCGCRTRGRPSPLRATRVPMLLQRLHGVRTERNRPQGPLRLRRLELALEHRFPHRQRPDIQIERTTTAAPAARQSAIPSPRSGSPSSGTARSVAGAASRSRPRR